MGIEDIHLLKPDLEYRYLRQQEVQVRIAREQKLVDDHRQGKHSWGKMIRECPLCPDR